MANELVDICETYCCWCFYHRFPVATPPQMVEAFKKVCQQVNEAKLFNMGLQCRAGLYKIHVNRGGNIGVAIEFYVLVEKRDDEKLRNVETLDTTLEYTKSFEPCPREPRDSRDHKAAVLGWSPPANWMARCYDFPTPSNETTN